MHCVKLYIVLVLFAVASLGCGTVINLPFTADETIQNRSR